MAESSRPSESSENDPPASEALREAQARAAARNRIRTATAVGVAAGIGSAALAAAFLYANRGRKKDDA